MCFLCVASKWSRRVVAMLPWLIIPLVIVWVLSQLLPPGFRFEITSPRLACLCVLIFSLAWYELVMPRLTQWRERRNIELRERQRIEAQVAAKWRKEATRRCRNCSYAYRDQNPCGGKFTCTYCGHTSKRPGLDLPGGIAQVPGATGIAGVGPLLTGRIMPDKAGWPGGKTWGASNGHAASPWSGSQKPWAGTDGWGATPWLENQVCSSEQQSWLYFIFKRLYIVCFWFQRLSMNVWKNGINEEDRLGKGGQRKGEEIAGLLGRKAEKARRKAEERRLARLERELEEEKERKQREEVAQLVEEQRRIRDEKLELERVAAAERERELRREKEAERRKQEKARLREKEKENSLVDGELEEAKKMKTQEQEGHNGNERKGDLKWSNGNGNESRGHLKHKGSDLLLKGNNSVKTSAKAAGSIKGSNLTSPKTALRQPSFWGSGFHFRGRGDKRANSTVSSPVSTSSGGVVTKVVSSSSAWNRMPWNNVWGKGSTTTAGFEDHNSTSEWHSHTTGPTGAVISEHSLESSQQNDTGGMKFYSADGNGLQDLGLLETSQLEVPLLSRPNLSMSSSTLTKCILPEHLGNLDVQQQQPETDIFFEPLNGNIACEHSFNSLASLSGSTPLDCMSDSVTDPIHLPVSTSPLPPISAPHATATADTSNITSLHMPVSFALDLFSSGVLTHTISTIENSHQDGLISSQRPVSLQLPVSLPSSATSWSPSPLLSKQLPSILEPWVSPMLDSNDPSNTPKEVKWKMWDAPDYTMPWKVPLEDELLQQKEIPDLSPELLERANELTACLLERQGPQAMDREVVHTRSNDGWSNHLAVESAMSIWDDSDIHRQVPPEFVDCITREVMKDPVITADGHSYERSAIEFWLKSHDTSPITGEVLPPPPGGDGTGIDKSLRPNHILRGQILEYMERLSRGAVAPQEIVEDNWSVSSVMRDSTWLTASPKGAQIGEFYSSPGNQSLWSFNAS